MRVLLRILLFFCIKKKKTHKLFKPIATIEDPIKSATDLIVYAYDENGWDILIRRHLCVWGFSSEIQSRPTDVHP